MFIIWWLAQKLASSQNSEAVWNKFVYVRRFKKMAKKKISCHKIKNRFIRNR